MFYKEELKDIRYFATLQGDFNRPEGAVAKDADGLHFVGDGYEWSSTTESHPSGVYRRTDKIKNISNRPIDLRTVLSKFSFHGGEYEVYTQYNEWCGEGYGKWQELVTEVSAEGESVRNNSGASPFVALWCRQSGRGRVFHILADSLWMFKVKRFFKSAVDKRVEVELGILSRGFDYTLKPGGELTLPTVLYYDFRNRTDMDSYKLHRYYNDIAPARSLPIVYNSWLSDFDNISYDLLAVQLEKAAALGAEYFVIDAGWFGAPRKWNTSVGDWDECTTASMCGRMKEFSDLVRSKGLKFGLWFEPERATRMAKAPKEHPDYYFFELYDYFLNFGNEEARNYIFDILAERIRHYGIEFIKFDFNAEMTYDRAGEAFLPYFEGYRLFIDRLRAEFPDLYLENCASGGERMSLSSLRGFDSFWASDNHSIYKQVQMYKSNILHMPSRTLETWVTVQSMKEFGPVYASKPEYAEPIIACGEAAWRHVEGVFSDYLLAAMMGGPIGFSCNLTRISPRLFEVLSNFVQAYKNDRAFWMDSECHVLCDTDSMLVLQFNDRAFSQIKLCAFSQMPLQYSIGVFPFCDTDAVFVTETGEESDARTLNESGVEMSVPERFRASMMTLKKK